MPIRKVLATLVATCFAVPEVYANPVGANVVAGQATIKAQGPLLTVTNTPGAIIHWQGFSIGASETTRFIQQSAVSSVLNRVVAPDPSVILGNLWSNGKVFLINPAGILVGQGARIDVGGFVASTLNLSNQDFLAGRLNFQPNLNAGDVVNRGLITTPNGGSVYLVAPNVTNSGVINTPQGETILAAGRSVQLIDTGTPGVRLELSANDNKAENLGEIIAQSGKVGLVGALVRHRGTISADQIVRGGDGKVWLRARQDVALEPGSRITANGERGGEVTVVAEQGATRVNGAIETRGTSLAGGVIKTLGRSVEVTGSLDASGAAGGGTVLVGGDYQGRNPEVQNARATAIGQGALIRADATEVGDGGKVIVWSDEATRVNGTISARGGALGGDGGFVETSGAQLQIGDSVIVSTAAPRGKSGAWLLDPNDFTIAASGGNISGATLSSNLSGNVVIDTATQGSAGNGDIFVNDNVSWSGNTSLTLNAQRNINVNAVIAASGNTAGLTLTPNTASLGGVYSLGTGGRIDLTGSTPSLFIGGQSYTVINSLGVAGDSTTSTLQGMKNGLAGRYALGSNVDASATSGWNSGQGFEPVGSIATKFTGTFDGLGHTITGLTMNRPGTSYVGLFGYADTGSAISNVGLTNADVTGGVFVGALIGENWTGASVNNAYSTGSVVSVASSPNSIVGGLVGRNTGAISNSYSTATAFGNYDNAGGLVGINSIDTSPGTITNSYSTGAANGRWNVGGLAGTNYGTITNSFSISRPTQTGSNIGGLVGNSIGGTVTNSYWDTETSGRGSSQGGTGLTTAQMMQSANLTGFDFTNTWNIVAGTSYPYLRWQFSGTPQIVSGTVTGSGGPGTRVQLIANGANLAPMYKSGANGFYYVALPGNSVPNGGTVVSYVTADAYKGAAAHGSTGGHLTGMNITESTLTIGGGSVSNSGLGTAKGSLASSDIPYSVSGGNLSVSTGFAFRTLSGASYTLDGSVTTVNAGQTWSGPVTMTANATLAAGSGAIAIDGGISGAAQNLTINTTGNVTQSAGISVAGLELLGTGGNYQLTNTGNAITTLAGNTGTVSLVENSGFAVGTVNSTVGLTTSGNTTLSTTGAVTQTAPITAAGLELLGTGATYTLTNSGNDITTLAGSTGTVSLVENSGFAVGTVNTTQGLTATGDVTLVAEGTGNVTVSKSILKDGAAAAMFALRANNNIIFDSSAGIGLAGGASNTVTAVLNADKDGDGAGNIQLNAGTVISSNGGNITMGGGVPVSGLPPGAAVGAGTGTSAASAGIYLNGATLDAGAGNISLRGTGVAGTSSAYGIGAWGGSRIQSTSGTVSLTGTGGAGTNDNYGVLLQTNSQVSTVDGAISVTGLGVGTTSYNMGVYIHDGAVVSASGAGSITLNGTGSAAGTSSNRGVRISASGPGTRVTSASGSISVTGIGGGDGDGVQVVSGAVVQSGTGAITLTGTGGAGSSDERGVYLDTSAQISTVDGAVTVTGRGGAASGGYNYGVYLTGGGTTTGSSITSTGTGMITLDGTGGSGTSNNYGVRLSTGMHITSAAGDVLIKGQGGGNGGGSSNYGIIHTGASGAMIASSGSASITLDGRGKGGAAGVNSNRINGSVAGGNVTLIADTDSGADSIILAGPISGTGNLYLQPRTAASTIGIAGGAGTFNLSSAELDTIQSGFAGITIGRADGTGAINVGAYNWRDALTLRSPGSGSGGIAIGGATSLGAKNLTLNTAGAVTQTAAITAAGLELLGTGGTYTLTHPGNTISTLTGNTGPINFINGSGFTVGALTATGSVSLVANAGNLTLGSGSTVGASGAGDAVVLAAGGNFVNNAGASALSITGGGRWLVYAADPATSTFGNLNSGNAAVWNVNYGSYPPASVTQAGNRYLFGFQPTVTFTSTDASKVYGTDATSALATSYAVSGLHPGVTNVFLADTSAAAYSGTPSITSAGSPSTAHAGTYSITPGTGTLAAQNGYGLAYSAAGNLSVTPASLTLTANDQSKTYGSTLSFAGTEFTSSGLQNSETVGSVTLASTGATASAHVAGSPYAISATGATGGTFTASDYSISYVPGTLTVTPAPLAVTGIVANNKVYDATTAAALNTDSASVSGVLSGDSVALVAGTGSFADKNVGTAKPVTASGFGITGTDAPNYALAQPTGLAADITPATLTATGVAANNKVYDATTAATLNTGTAALSGVLSGDSVALAGGSGSFANKNVGNAKPVTVSSLPLSGSDAGNYVLSAPTGLTANITPATLTLSGASAANKVYDGTTNASVSGTLSGVIAGDSVNFAGTATFADKNAGTGKAVTGITLTGADAANYTAINPTGLTANITQKPLSTWIGSTGGLWSSPANWDGGAVPDGANVLAVSIPGSSSNQVTYDATAGSTTLKTLDSTQGLLLKGGTLTLGTASGDASTIRSGAALEVQSGGSLSVTGNLTTDNFLQSGGSVGGTGSFAVTSSFSQSGGTIAPNFAALAIQQASGNLNVGSLSAVNTLALDAVSGKLTATGTLSAGTTVALSGEGVSVQAVNGGAVAIDAKGGLLEVNGAVTSGGNPIALAAADMNIAAPINAGAGSVVITNSSGGPVTLGGGLSGFGLSNAELNRISAASLTLNLSPVTVDGPVDLTSVGALTVNASSLAVNHEFDVGAPVTVNCTGDVAITAGAGEAEITGSALNVSAANVRLRGGSAAGAYVGLWTTVGDLSVATPASGVIELVSGTGAGATARIGSAGNVAVSTGTCMLCAGNMSARGSLTLLESVPQVVVQTTGVAVEQQQSVVVATNTSTAATAPQRDSSQLSSTATPPATERDSSQPSSTAAPPATDVATSARAAPGAPVIEVQPIRTDPKGVTGGEAGSFGSTERAAPAKEAGAEKTGKAEQQDEKTKERPKQDSARTGEKKDDKSKPIAKPPACG